MPSESRQATVLFADIAGFTAISEKLDPERVTEIMNRCFEVLEEIVVVRGGEINKYLGDCVMAIFGLDGATDSTHRAVQAALEIRAAVLGLNQQLELPSRIGVHVGIDTGLVSTGEIGGDVRREFTVTGHTVHVATRLEDISEAGQIFVGPTTRSTTEDEFDYLSGPTIQVDGIQVPVFELIGPSERRRHVKRPSERRQATVMFSDIQGFTELRSRLAPDEQRDLLNRCFTGLERIVHAHGGVVDKYVGECVIALFGVPDAIEDAPKQAVNAAIDMRNEIECLAKEFSVPLRIRAGINTGLVIAGEIGGRIKRDYTVMGDTVNVASRLKDAASRGAILLGAKTHRATQRAFEFREVEPLRLKGKSEPISSWEVLSESAQMHRLSEQRGTVRSKLIGRDSDFATLRRCIEALATGKGGVVSLIGEAGLGKSRLMAEVLASDACKSVRVLEARSTAVGRNLSFHPFVELFRQWAGIADDTPEPEAQARLRSAIVGLDADSGDESFPFIATLMGMHPESPAADRLRGIEGEALERLIFKNVRELLASLAATKPLLLVFDDVHWADQSSIGLLESLLRLAEGSAVLFIHLFRPQYEQTSDRVLNAVSAIVRLNHTVIRLEALTALQSEELVETLLRIEDLPQSTRRLIVGKAEGNPYYLEEVVRSLVDLGAIEETADGYRVTERIESVEIPSTIEEVILARVDRLDESTRHVLQLGAVIGRTFYYSLMTELIRREGVSDERLDKELTLLKQKQLLRERGAGWTVTLSGGDLVQEIEYLFQHGLAQEAIYGSLLRTSRTTLHAIVASAIEEFFSHRLPDFYPMLAYHFSRANDLEKAEDYLFKAGEKAASKAASSEALNCFREAARLYIHIHGTGGDPRKKALLEKNIGSALLTTGQLSESIEHYDQALEWLGVRLAGDARLVMLRFAADLSAVLTDLYLRARTKARRVASPQEREIFDIMFRRFKALTTSDPKRLFIDNIGMIRRMNALDPKTVEQACLAYCLGSAAFSYSGASFAISRKFFERASSLLNPENIAELVGYGFTRFTIRFLSGEWGEEPGIEDAVIEEALRHGVFWDVNSYLGLECDRQIRTGRFAEAERYLGRLEELGGSYGYEFAVTNHDGMRALLFLERRQLDEALYAAEHYLKGRHEDALRVLALGIRAKTRLLRNEQGDARADLEQAEALVRKSEVVPPWHLSSYTTAELRYLAERVRDTGKPPAGVRAMRRSIRRAVRVASRVAGARPETYRLVARIEWSLGHEGRAVRWWDKAIAESKCLDAQPELARALVDSAHCWEHSKSARLRDRSVIQFNQYREIGNRLGLSDLAGVSFVAIP